MKSVRGKDGSSRPTRMAFLGLMALFLGAIGLLAPELPWALPYSAFRQSSLTNIPTQIEGLITLYPLDTIKIVVERKGGPAELIVIILLPKDQLPLVPAGKAEISAFEFRKGSSSASLKWTSNSGGEFVWLVAVFPKNIEHKLDMQIIIYSPIPSLALLIGGMSAIIFSFWRRTKARAQTLQQPIISHAPPLPAPSVKPLEPLPTAKTCVSCGTQISVAAAYCRICGAKQYT